MNVVTFGDVAASYDRALQEVLAGFLDGGTHTLAQISMKFLAPEIDVGFRLLDNTIDSPVITFLGSSFGKTSYEHVKDPLGNKPFAYEERCTAERKMFVRTKILQDPNIAERTAKQLWGQMAAIFCSQKKAFADRGIFIPHLDPSPQYLKSLDSVVYWGYLYCNLRYTYTCDT